MGYIRADYQFSSEPRKQSKRSLSQPYVGESNLIDQMFKPSSLQERQLQHSKEFFFLLSNGYLRVSCPRDWENILGLTESSGIMNISPNPLKSGNHTLASICEKLFQMVLNHIDWTLGYREGLRERTMTLLGWLFSPGQVPGNPYVSHDVHGHPLFYRVALAAEKYKIAAMLQAIGSKLPDQKNRFVDGIGAIDTSGASHVHEPATTLWLDDVREYNISYFIARRRPWQPRLYHKDCMGFENVIKERVTGSVRYVGSISPIGLLCLEFQEHPTQTLNTVQSLLDLQVLDGGSSGPAILLLLDDLIAACFSESEELFLLILSKFTHVNTSVREAPSPLHAATFAGNLRFCELLLSKGALLAGPAEFTHLPTPLHLAALNGHTDIVDVLYMHGTSIYKRNNELCRHIGCRYCGLRPRICREAMHSPIGGAILFDLENETWTGNHISAVLARHGATVPPWVLHMGAACANADMVMFALKNGVDVNHRHEGLPAWHHLLIPSFLHSDLYEHPFEGPNPRNVDGVMRIAEILVDAGIDMCGGMATMSAFLRRPDLTQRMLDLDIRRVHKEEKVIKEDADISLLEAAVLSECADMIDWALKRSASVYDPRALSSAVRLYCQRRLSENFGRQLILRLLNGRDKALEPNGFEGLAVSICIVYEREELLNDLLATLPPSKLAFSPDRPDFWARRLGRIRDSDATEKLKRPGEKSTLAWYDKVSPLMYAVNSDDLTNRLINQGYVVDNDTMAAAVRRGNLKQIKTLIACYTPSFIHTMVEPRRHYIYEAIQANRLDIVSVLWDQVGESDEFRRQCDPLHVAVLFGRVEIVDYLLSHGADVDEAAYVGSFQHNWTCRALQIAAELGSVTMVQVLLKHGADINKIVPDWDVSLLEAAARTGRIDMLQLLLNEGAMTTGKYRRHYASAIFFAEKQGHMSAARILRGCREWTEEDEILLRKFRKYSRF